MDNRENFFCSITHEVMQDPVVDPEGNTYEREAITAWLASHDTSPITRTPLLVSQLAPNRVLKAIIQEELKKSLESGDTQWTKEKQVVPINVNPSTQDNQPEVLLPAVSEEERAKAEEVVLKVTTKKEAGGDILVHTSILPGQGITRSPIDVCCVVDISGSMGSEASVKTGEGKEERHGLSLLDIVKHAVKTVVHSLDESDRFSLVAFSTTARVVLDLRSIRDRSKDLICKKIDDLEPEDTTNLWDGLLKGLEVLATSTAGRVSALLVLTDGMPNVTPPRGELAMLKKYKDEHKQLNTTINTFGFGYQIDTPLLLSIASEGHGGHSFIPDASFVGTAFVNCISNLLVTMATNVTVAIEPQHGSTIKQVLGGFQHLPTSWGAQVNMCSLQYGQGKDLVVRLSAPTKPNDGDLETDVVITLKYDDAKSGTQQSKEVSSALPGADLDFEVQQLRLDFVSAVSYMLELAVADKDNEMKVVLSDIEQQARKCNDPRAQALLQDITGQVKEALKKSPQNYYQKWGRHYLPSLSRAHLLQQCNNFKDPGIQVYGGQLFQQKRDQIDDIFVKLPPPKPSVRRTSSASNNRGGSYVPAVSMSVYHNSAGPCFAGEGKVQMNNSSNGLFKLVEDIVQGDLVFTPSGPATILCVIKTHCVDKQEDLVVFPNGLRVTPFHPVRVNERWSFPSDLHACQPSLCSAVYNFVLDQGHVMCIDGVECVTLGHGLEEEVVKHPYFGTKRVVDDLMQMAGWAKGLIELHPAACPAGKSMIRDTVSGLVCGFAPEATRVPTTSRDM